MSRHCEIFTAWAFRRRDLQKTYERLDRHVRTSATVRELLHWECERVKSQLSVAYDKPLRKAIRSKMRKLQEVTT
jgi:hypothetical protein